VDEEEDDDESAPEGAGAEDKIAFGSKADDDDDEESEEEDDDFDFSAVAAKAVKAVQDGKRRLAELPPMGLDVGLDERNLYFTSRGSGSGKTKVKAFQHDDVPHGVARFNIEDFDGGYEADAASTKREEMREVRGTAPRPADDRSIRKKEAKAHKEERLKKWFGMRKREHTPEVVKELKAIKLRSAADPKRFYKANDTNELPKYFTFATEVGGGMAAAGEKATQREVHAHSGKSLLSSMMKDEKVQEFTYKTRRRVCDRGEAGRHSGHGKGAPKKGKKRGGPWKKAGMSRG